MVKLHTWERRHLQNMSALHQQRSHYQATNKISKANIQNSIVTAIPLDLVVGVKAVKVESWTLSLLQLRVTDIFYAKDDVNSSCLGDNNVLPSIRSRHLQCCRNGPC